MSSHAPLVLIVVRVRSLRIDSDRSLMSFFVFPAMIY